MALDVWVGSWNSFGSHRALSFEPEAHYWFIYPLVESLGANHGKYFDPWDGCEFKPNELHLFKALIDSAEALARKRPERFSVHIVTHVEPAQKELFAEVDRSAFLAFLDSLRDVTRVCERKGKSLHLYGD